MQQACPLAPFLPNFTVDVLLKATSVVSDSEVKLVSKDRIFDLVYADGICSLSNNAQLLYRFESFDD